MDFDSKHWHPRHPARWAVPDLLGYFAQFIAMINVGEESGALDIELLRVRDTNLNGGVVDLLQSNWAKNVLLFALRWPRIS